MDHDKEYVLIAAFLSGEANADQVNDLRVWLAESEKNRIEFEEIKSVWLNSHFDHHIENLDSLFQQAKNKIGIGPTANARRLYERSASHKYLKFARWAAVAAVIVLISVTAIHQYTIRDNQPVAAVEKIIKENPAGLKTTFTLPDGTKVSLNSESKLAYNSLYGTENRDIQLVGEAYFEVAKNPVLPFRVSSADKVVEALGTAFNVRAFADEDKMNVMLVEGKVKIWKAGIGQNARGGVTLNPGQEFVADLNTGQIEVDKIDEDALLWKKDVVHFKRASMGEVVKVLERWYGVHFIIRGNINPDWNYTGKFSRETLENVLRSISYSKQFEFEIEHKNVIVKPIN